MELVEVDEDRRSRKRSATMREMQIRMEVSSQPSILLFSSRPRPNFRCSGASELLNLPQSFDLAAKAREERHSRSLQAQEGSPYLEILSVLFRTMLT
jgi:hypothetical protein